MSMFNRTEINAEEKSRIAAEYADIKKRQRLLEQQQKSRLETLVKWGKVNQALSALRKMPLLERPSSEKEPSEAAIAAGMAEHCLRGLAKAEKQSRALEFKQHQLKEDTGLIERGVARKVNQVAAKPQVVDRQPLPTRPAGWVADDYNSVNGDAPMTRREYANYPNAPTGADQVPDVVAALKSTLSEGVSGADFRFVMYFC